MNDGDSNTLAVLGIFAALLTWLLWSKRPTASSTRLWVEPEFGGSGYWEEIPTEDATMMCSSFGAGRR